MKCGCGNTHYGFDCVCDCVKNHPGNKEYVCEFCGLYKASEPRCNKCEQVMPPPKNYKIQEMEIHE